MLGGGLATDRLYLIEGNPGAGKTTLAMQFLLEGIRQGDAGLYVTLSESVEELRSVADSHGWDVRGVHLFELAASVDSLEPESQYTMFHPAEVELSETTRQVLAQVEATNPRRVVFDSLSEMRLLAQNPLRYRRQILALKQFFTGRRCTVLLLDDRTSEQHDLHLQSIAHGVVSLEQLVPEFGAERRRLRVAKMRGTQYRGGHHDFKIVRGGLEVYPRLVAAEHHSSFSNEFISSNIEGIDTLLGGGLSRGMSALLMGPAGSGKSTLALQYAVAAAERGEAAAIFTFDESIYALRSRARGMGIDLDRHLENGMIIMQQVDPAELSPGEFVATVRHTVRKDGPHARLVVIDSLNGYLNAMPEERFLLIQLHELLTYLGHQGVVSLLLMAQHGLVGSGIQSPVDASYLADSIILMRYYEMGGEVRQAISVMKKRSGAHERAIRDFRMTSKGIEVGRPLRDFHGILSGLPTPSHTSGNGAQKAEAV